VGPAFVRFYQYRSPPSLAACPAQHLGLHVTSQNLDDKKLLDWGGGVIITVARSGVWKML